VESENEKKKGSAKSVISRVPNTRNLPKKVTKKGRGAERSIARGPELTGLSPGELFEGEV